MLVEHAGYDEDGTLVVEGRAEHQGPEVDGTTALVGEADVLAGLTVGDLVEAVAVGHDGVDLVAEPTSGSRA